MEILRHYHAAMGYLIVKFDGKLERLARHNIMFFFNDPVPCPDPTVNAMQMALEIRAQIVELR
jgi:class 3 adenylate cyclase